MGRRIQLEVQPGRRPLVEKYRALYRKYRALVDRRGPDLTDERGRTALAERREEKARVAAAEQERLRAMGDLASSTAHEINNVLHSMALRLAALRGPADDAAREAGLSALARMVSDAATCVARFQDAAGRSRAAPRTEQLPGTRPGAVPELPRLRVLVVDDDPDVLEAARLALAHLGQSVDGAPSGAEAVARFMAGERFDLVLCDIGMPQLDGWQVAREVRALSPETRLYLVSGWAREIPPEEVQRAGAAGLLAKPLSFELLRAVLAMAPGTAPAGSAPAPTRRSVPVTHS